MHECTHTHTCTHLRTAIEEGIQEDGQMQRAEMMRALTLSGE